MRKLIIILLPLILLYTTWYYFQKFNDQPLQEQLSTIAAEEVAKVIITGPQREVPLSMTRIDDGWVVTRSPRQILDQSVRVQTFVDRLTALTTDSVSWRRDLDGGTRVVLKGTSGREDEFILIRTKEGTPLAQVVATGDVFHLPPATARYIFPALEFEHYREQRLLHLLPGQVDSIVASRHDSTLWVIDSALTSLSEHFLAPASAPYADHFDEIAHRDRYHADLDFYFSGRAHRIQVFQDSLWPQPYVLVGTDFPRRYLGFTRIR